MRLLSLSLFLVVLAALAVAVARNTPRDAPLPAEQMAIGPAAASAAPPLTTPVAATRAPIDGKRPFHVKASHVWTSPSGERKEVRDTEFWLDPVTQNARYDQKSRKPDGYHSIEIRRGMTHITYFPREKQMTVTTVVDPAVKGLQLVQEYVLRYKGALERGEMRPARRDEVAAGGLSSCSARCSWRART